MLAIAPLVALAVPAHGASPFRFNPKDSVVTANAILTAETDVVSGVTNLVFSYHIPIEGAPACSDSDDEIVRWVIESHPMLLGLLVAARSPALAIARIRQAISLAAHAADQTGHPSLIRQQRLQADRALWSTIANTTRDLLNRSIDADTLP